MKFKYSTTLALCTLLAQPVAWAEKVPNPVPAAIPKGDVTIGLKTIAKNLVNPTTATFAPKDKDRLFVTEQNGKIWSIKIGNGKGAKAGGGGKRLLADLGDLGVNLGCFTTNYDERGLFGLAFHPNYNKNGLIYTFQSQPPKGSQKLAANKCNSSVPDHDNVITEWKVKNPSKNNAKVDTDSGREILRVAHPQFNHNGGEIRFGPDGMLYIAIGDGGNADDQGEGHTTPGGNGQDLTKLLGKILRIDPIAGSASPGYKIPSDNPFAGSASARGEIWAYGFRNPFKMSFDRPTGQLYVADVGQNHLEEINIVTKGKNYGWPIKEGSYAFDQNGPDSGFVTDEKVVGDFVDPIAQYDHCLSGVNLTGPCSQKEGVAIVGGFVYRGKEIKALRGRYVFGDYSTEFSTSAGRLFYLDAQNQVKEFNLAGGSQLGTNVLGIGQDARGELYVMGKTGATRSNTGITDPNNTSATVRRLVARKGSKSGGSSNSSSPSVPY